MFVITKKKQSVETSQELIEDEEFKNKHRKSNKAFTRVRKLHFSLLLVLILQKSMKSIQLILNEFTSNFSLETISNSAYTQARANLKYTAFIELNQKAVVDVMYKDDNIKLYKAMRVIGIDGSKILLPDSAEIKKEFGEISYSNDHPEVKGSHNYGLASVMYDVLNRVAVDSVLSHARAYEVDLAIKHLAHGEKNDLLLHDRNYASYFYLATLCSFDRNFVTRCSSASFKKAQEMLRGEGSASQIVTLQSPPDKLKTIEANDLPKEITIRFVRVQLETGEYEVLVMIVT